jgi:hypothetical protein
MASVTKVAASVRIVRNDPEDTLDVDSASGYTPVLGEVVALSAAGTVNLCDATDSASLTVPLGLVVAFKQKRAGGYRITVLTRGLVEGWTGMTVTGLVRLWTSETAGAIDTTDPTTTGVTGFAIGRAINATQILFNFPA